MPATPQPRHSNLSAWWTDDPNDLGRLLLQDPDVQRMLAAISPKSHYTDLGGTMSLNVKLDAAHRVLRVHQPFVTRQRLLALQNVRRHLANQKFIVPTAVTWKDKFVFRCKNRWAELEEYLPHNRQPPTLESYRWMFSAMGTLHRSLAQLAMTVPRPLIATYAPPSSLHRWLPTTQAAVQANPESADIARRLRTLVQQVRRQWVPETALPMQFIHGDVRLSNICKTLDGTTVYFDFGFLARRPRIHELAYALFFMIFALGGQRAPESFAWECVPRLIEEYETTAGICLTSAERKALAPYTASVALYAAAHDGFSENPVERIQTRVPFLHLGAWLLAHPAAVLGETL